MGLYFREVKLQNLLNNFYFFRRGKWQGRLEVPGIGVPKPEEWEITFLVQRGEKLESWKLPLEQLLEWLNREEGPKRGVVRWWKDFLELVDYHPKAEELFSRFPGEIGLKRLEDITDWEFNNFSRLDRTFLQEEGIWIGSGRRFWELEFNGEWEWEGEWTPRLIVKQIENRPVEEIPELKLSPFPGVKGGVVVEGGVGEQVGVLHLDTDLFLPLIDRKNSRKVRFPVEGVIEVGIGEEIPVFLQQQGEPVEERGFGLPIRFSLANPTHPNYWKRGRGVVIDFGTSSTCVAVGEKLIPFSDTPRQLEDFESMTAITLYNWEKVWSQWQPENPYPPHFVRNKKEVGEWFNRAAGDHLYYHYDYGNRIRREFSVNPQPEVIKGTIEQIKLLPFRLQREEVGVFPLDQSFRRVVYLTDRLGEESPERLNPIYLYGYLIGRGVNRQIGGELYTNYRVTMPVRFSAEVKELLRAGLEVGLRRAMPKPLQPHLKLRLGHLEPVALIGAARYLGIIDGDVVPFAIFDFGGGTLDYVVGVYRTRLTEEEEEQYLEGVDLCGVGGIEMGGEVLIERLAYRIYQLHRDEMEEMEIPIAVPKGEEPLPHFPEKLLSQSHLAQLNLRSLVEGVARPLFERNFHLISADLKVDLFSISDQLRGIPVQLKGLTPEGLEQLEQWLKGEIEMLIFNFYNFLREREELVAEEVGRWGRELSRNFQPANREGEVGFLIIKAGNASKNELVQQGLEQFFPREMIKEINRPEVGITPKNGVAKGHYYLNRVHVTELYSEEGSFRFHYNIWRMEELAKGSPKPAISQGESENAPFQRVGLIGEGEEVVVYYSETPYIENQFDPNLRRAHFWVEEEFLYGNWLWVRPARDKILEGKIVSRDGVELQQAPSFYLDLDREEVLYSLDEKEEE